MASMEKPEDAESIRRDGFHLGPVAIVGDRQARARDTGLEAVADHVGDPGKGLILVVGLLADSSGRLASESGLT